MLHNLQDLRTNKLRDSTFEACFRGVVDTEIVYMCRIATLLFTTCRGGKDDTRGPLDCALYGFIAGHIADPVRNHWRGIFKNLTRSSYCPRVQLFICQDFDAEFSSLNEHFNENKGMTD